MQTYQLAGVDLAWVSDSNPTAIAYGFLSNNQLIVNAINQDLFGVESILDSLGSTNDLHGIAIDASLIINNQTGQRACERLIGKAYAKKKATCHASNLTLYPDADSVKLSQKLCELGFTHIGNRKSPWQLECYPHPAIIEIFSLYERHQYKKGSVEDKRRGQCELADMLMLLAQSKVLRLVVPEEFRQYFDNQIIRSLRGSKLKHNEDVLDAIVCLYVAGLYQIGNREKVFGGIEEGYIYVPQNMNILDNKGLRLEKPTQY